MSCLAFRFVSPLVSRLVSSFRCRSLKQRLTISHSADVAGGDVGGVEVGVGGPGVGDAVQITLGQEGRGSSLVGNDKICKGDGGAKTVGKDMVFARGPGTVRILNFDGESVI